MPRPIIAFLLRYFVIFSAIALASLLVQDASAQTHGTSKLASLHVTQAENNDDGTFWGALEIILAPHVKTYWRTAGEAGLPPRFDWSASENLADLTLAWPRPIRFEDGGGHSIGYDQTVLLPLLIKPINPQKPVTLDLTVDYAVCEKLCLPMHDRIKLVFDKNKTPANDVRQALHHALMLVPKKLEMGTSERPAIERVISEGDMVRVDTRIDADTHIDDVFIEGPDGWVFAAPVHLNGPGNGRQSFLVSVLERPHRDDQLANLTLSLTLVTRNLSSETVLTLDKQGRAP